ncbi:unnamed protein product [Lathyrus oleraceus]
MKAAQIFDLFVVHGTLKEVVIPPKRNKFGKRFDFARFSSVEDCTLLVVKLDNFFIDSNKIYANVPKFKRNEGEALKCGFHFKGRILKPSLKEEEARKAYPSLAKVDVKSFAEVVNKGKSFNVLALETPHVHLKF